MDFTARLAAQAPYILNDFAPQRARADGAEFIDALDCQFFTLRSKLFVLYPYQDEIGSEWSEPVWAGYKVIRERREKKEAVSSVYVFDAVNLESLKTGDAAKSAQISQAIGAIKRGEDVRRWHTEKALNQPSF